MLKKAPIRAIVFVLLAVVYLLSLATVEFKLPEYPDWLFNADTREHILKGDTNMIGRQVWIAKHPAFPVFARPVFWVGRAFFDLIASPPLSENLSITLHSAFYGALSVLLGHWLFLKNDPDRFAAAIFSVLLGGSTAWWVYASFPESYALTSFLTIVAFVPLVVGSLDDRRILILSTAACALACWGTPQVFWTLSLPATYFLVRYRISKKTIVAYLIIAAVFTLLYLAPYVAYLELREIGRSMPKQYSKQWFYYAPIYTLQVPFNLFLTSVVGPSVHPDLYSSESFELLTKAPWWWYPIAAAFVGFAGWCLANVRSSTSYFREHAPGIIVFLFGYMVMFNFFNPKESYLYTMQSLFGWLLLLHTGFVAIRHRRARHVAVAMTVLIVVNSAAMMWFIRSIANPIDLGQVKKPKATSALGVPSTTIARKTTAWESPRR